MVQVAGTSQDDSFENVFVGIETRCALHAKLMLIRTGEWKTGEDELNIDS